MARDDLRPHLSDWQSGDRRISPAAWIGMMAVAVIVLIGLVGFTGYLINGA